jgi:hypothetical protein
MTPPGHHVDHGRTAAQPQAAKTEPEIHNVAFAPANSLLTHQLTGKSHQPAEPRSERGTLSGDPLAPLPLPLPLQAKLEVGAVNDPLEHEADRIAQTLMRMPDGGTLSTSRCACGGTPGPDGECASCHTKRLARDAVTPAAPAGQDAPTSVHATLARSGRALDSQTRAFFEPRLGVDLGAVRVHDDALAAASAADVHAHAYTVGHNIVFGAGRYQSGSPTKRDLLAHELVHVVQQGEATHRPAEQQSHPHDPLRLGEDAATQLTASDKPGAPGAVVSEARHHPAIGNPATARSQRQPAPPGRDALLHDPSWGVNNHSAPRKPLARPRRVSSAALVQRAPESYPGALDTERVEDMGGRHIRISEFGNDPHEKLQPGQKPTLIELFWVDFEVDASGTIKASIRTVDATGKYRSPTLRAKEAFADALTYFQTKGKTEVQRFEGDWSWMSATEISVNLQVYNAQRRAGAKPEEAARQTPSGRIAVAAGFTEVKVLSDKLEKLEDIGDGKVYQRVRVSFSRPGGGKPPTGTGKAAPPARSGGGGSTTKTSTKVTATGALLILGASITLDWLIESGNEGRIRAERERIEHTMLKEQEMEPTLGFLLIFRYDGGATGLEGSSASPRFTRLSWRRGYTESEAKASWDSEARNEVGVTHQFGWVPPLTAPSPMVMATPFEKAAVAKWADIRKIEFQRVQFKEWGGFDTAGRDGPYDGARWAKVFEAQRFIVLRMPTQIQHLDINRRFTTKKITIKDQRIAGGTVPAVLLDGTPAIAVWAADEPTAQFFRGFSRRIGDKENKLEHMTNIEFVRWLPPEQIKLVHDQEPEPVPRRDEAR